MGYACVCMQIGQPGWGQDEGWGGGSQVAVVGLNK